MQIEEAIEKIQELLNLTNWYPKYGYKEAIVTTLKYIDIMKSEFDRLEGIEDNTAMLKYELEKKDNKIKELEGRCRNLDKEAQSYFEELMGDSTLKNRTIKQLNSELEKKDKVIDLLADDLRYYEGMQQDQLFCIDTCEGKMCDEEHCKERIKEYFYKKVE